MTVMHVVSVSGGKDSAATALLALETQPRESLRFVFADTGNEHELTYEYVDYMEHHLDITIDRVRAEFSGEIERKRQYVIDHWPRKGVDAAGVERALKALVPTGSPYLDLCIWKGRFPSPLAQFCTEFLKTKPLMEYQLNLIDEGLCADVWSWQGVRLDESPSRKIRLQGTGACVRSLEHQGGGIWAYRPILRWKAADCFDAARLFGLDPNPLYRLGQTRVGCMPCINSSKDEILAISKRFPGHIDRIEFWERQVGAASLRQGASFFPDPDRDAHLNKRGIRNVVRWSQTARGGQLIDFIRLEPAKACESAYGLCE